MYIPSSFSETDVDRLHEFLEANSFATLITEGESGIIASHLPLLLDRGAGDRGILLGHMARANVQWREVDEAEALVIFHGPHAYISPAWYAEENVVPTWNYVAVHVYGKIRIVSDQDVLLQTLRKMVEKYERGTSSPWSIDEPDDGFLSSLLDSIVGFEVAIDRIEGKWKLSQNHTVARRTRVVDALQTRGGEQACAIANLMKVTIQKDVE
ncbi:MAG: FMN-binding negative transcriptional regulator [Planctomycetaceae bacterium]|nr:FMN-binding negative transcriptional regulator [Planctomycetales bacterium]MCB9921726.1 FMN-binding negative transcriptional regulator [Planctomycetaceae bacterium]